LLGQNLCTPFTKNQTRTDAKARLISGFCLVLIKGGPFSFAKSVKKFLGMALYTFENIQSKLPKNIRGLTGRVENEVVCFSQVNCFVIAVL
jgi:hypothetical protein